MDITTRRAWGAKYAAGSGSVRLPVAETWLHHSVTAAPPSDPDREASAMRSLEGIGQQRFGQGVSYTFAVMPSGRVYEGTGAGRLGSHTGGRNSRSHGIVLVGNYEDAEPPEAMLRGVADLLRHGASQDWWKPRLNGGHRDLKQTACPGINAYRQISRINQMAASAVDNEEDDMHSTPIDLAPGEQAFLSVEPAKGFLGDTKSLLLLDAIPGHDTTAWVWAERGHQGTVAVKGGTRWVAEISGGVVHVRNDGDRQLLGSLLLKKV